MSPQLRKSCEKLPEKDCFEIQRRERETVHVAEVEFVTDGWPKNAEPLRYVAMRFTPIQGELFAERERGPKYLAVVTSRPQPAAPGEPKKNDEMSAADLIHWHREKAGTIEHVHRTMKDELAAGILPCQRFGANAAWFRINILTYNVLTFLKRRALPSRYRDARPKRLRFEVFALPGRLAFHQRQLSVNVSFDAAQVDELVAARGRLLHFHRALKQQR